MQAPLILGLELQFTPRSREVMAMLAKAMDPQRVDLDPTPAATSPAVELAPGEHYAGVVLDAAGQVLHHLVLLPQQPDKKLTWQAATDWAKSIGATLPTRQELSLLFANCKPHLREAWHWSSETHADDASSAWSCDFSYGYVTGNHKSYEGSAVAVRRI